MFYKNIKINNWEDFKMNTERIENMSDDEAIETLLGVGKLPTKTVVIPRLGIPVKIQALTGKQIIQIRKNNTRKVKIEGTRLKEDKLDDDNFNAGIIERATLSPKWNDPKLLDKFKSSSGKDVIKRLLLAGEMDSLEEQIFDLSGYNDGIEDIEDIKNSSSPDTDLD